MDKGKEIRIKIFEDTQNLMKNDELLKKDIDFSKENTRIYKEDYEFILNNKKNKKGNIKVVDVRSFKASENLENVVVLNFASATNPGGGVKTGAR